MQLKNMDPRTMNFGLDLDLTQSENIGLVEISHLIINIKFFLYFNFLLLDPPIIPVVLIITSLAYRIIF